MLLGSFGESEVNQLGWLVARAGEAGTDWPSAILVERLMGKRIQLLAYDFLRV